MKKIALLLAGVAALISLSACTVHANLTVNPDSLASNVASSLEQNGIKPNIDCGDDSIDLVKDNVVHCELSVDGDPTTLDTIVTITSVDGTDYTFTADVAAG